MSTADGSPAATAQDDRRSLVAMSVVYLGFAMPIAMLGVAWPSIRDELDRPNSALGVLGLAYGVGRLTTSASGGVLVGRMRFGAAAGMAAGVLAVGSLAIAASTTWPLLLVAVLVTGLASGALDSLGARYIAAVGSVGVAGLLAGSYGVGATIGPAVAAVGDRWRPAYVLAAAVCAVAAFAIARPGLAWPRSVSRDRDAADGDRPVPWRSAPVVLGFAAFYLFIGIEVTAGQWTATYLEDARSIDGRIAGLAVSGFWAGITVGRLLLGTTRIGVAWLPRLAVLVAAAVASMTLLPGAAVIAAAVAVGLALSPMFPTLLATTDSRVGPAAAPRVSGWQLVIGNIGATTMPALAGVAVALSDERAPIVILVAAPLAGALLLAALNRC